MPETGSGRPARRGTGSRQPGSKSNQPRENRQARPSGKEYGGKEYGGRSGQKPDPRHGGRTGENRHNDPAIPDEITPADLDFGARVQLKTLAKDNADEVARHLAMAGILLDSDPALAHQHALAAARRAGRVAIVRETVGLTAYVNEDFALALRELRTFRRISGSEDQTPVIVDCLRGVGRSAEALEEGHSVDLTKMDPETRVELAIALSGARLDLGQIDLALVELEIPELDPDLAFAYSPRLFRAYAEVLEELGNSKEAGDWLRRANIAEEALGLEPDEEDLEVIDLGFEEQDQ